LEEVIGPGIVIIQGDGIVSRHHADVGPRIGVFRGGLGDPMQVATAVPALVEHAHDEIITPRRKALMPAFWESRSTARARFEV